MKQTLELLAPAKNLACGKAAIDHGADAVYIGPPAGGARHAAGNSLEDIRELCRYAHQYACRVYATVNTIAFDSELASLRLQIASLKEAGVDAVLVQDMAVMQICQDLGVEVHASTQTDNRTWEKVAWLYSQGASRVVLARELSLSEIQTVHTKVPDVALEVFVHGALCVSFSGQCYASQFCFGRSANRGECAQFCRMKFNLQSATGETLIANRYLLSLKDMCRIDHIEQLAEAGACSFKIEGRLKDEDYVKNVVSAYRQRIDSLIARKPHKYARASMGTSAIRFTPDVRKSFNRGFTTYNLQGRQRGIASMLTPKAVGEPVGTVKDVRGKVLIVAGTTVFHNGDGLCYYDTNKQLCGFRVNRVEGNRLFLFSNPSGLHTGMPLYRNQDVEFESQLAKSCQQRKIPVLMSLTSAEQGVTLGMQCIAPDESSLSIAVTKILDLSPARTPQRDNQLQQLQKLGNTPLQCVHIDIEERLSECFIPSSVLADLRRDAVGAMISCIENYTVSQQKPSVAQQNNNADVPLQPDEPYQGLSYLRNVSNSAAQAFYAGCGIKVDAHSAMELQSDVQQRDGREWLLMQCHHCLRHELGYCVRHGGKKPQWKEPLYLQMGDGRRFRLRFDCRNCQMNVYAE